MKRCGLFKRNLGAQFSLQLKHYKYQSVIYALHNRSAVLTCGKIVALHDVALCVFKPDSEVESEILRGVYPDPPELAEGRRAQNESYLLSF
jgi:hypothetical protein